MTEVRLESGALLSLLDEAVVLARRVFGRLYLATALPPAIAVTVAVILQLRFMTGTLRNVSAEGPGAPFLAGMGLLFLVYFVYGGVTGLANAAMVAGTSWELEGTQFRARNVWRWVLRGRVLGSLMLLGLAIGLGFMFCFLPGLYLIIIYAIAVPVMATEGILGSQSMNRSKRLVLHSVEKRFIPPGMGWVIAVFVTAIVLSWGVSLAVQFPLTIIQQVLMARHLLGETARSAAPDPAAFFPLWLQVLQLVTMFASTLAKQAVALYSAAAFSLLFRRLRGRREGTDIHAALDALGAPA
jgi:hypothetical protein